jgi:hypothetical protein
MLPNSSLQKHKEDKTQEASKVYSQLARVSSWSWPLFAIHTKEGRASEIDQLCLKQEGALGRTDRKRAKESIA